jgi:hypothetical protein
MVKEWSVASSMASIGAASESQWTHLKTWLVFLVTLAVAQHLTLISTVDKLYEASQKQQKVAGADPVRRTYLMALCLYAVVSMWFRILFIIIMWYNGCVFWILLWGCLPPAVLNWGGIQWFLRMIDPSAIFHSISVQHMPAHGVILLASVVTPMIPLLFYLRKDDLVQPNVAITKTLRVVFVTPCLIGISYALYALLCFNRARALSP